MMLSTIVAVVVAAVPITLEETRQASRANLRVLQSQLDELRSQEQRRIALSAWLPQVSLSASPSISRSGTAQSLAALPTQNQETGEITTRQVFVESSPATRTGLDLSVSLNQLLYDAARWARVSQAGAEQEASQGQHYEEVMTSELEALRRFYQLCRAQRSLGVFESRVRDDEALLKRATDLFEAGKRNRGDVIGVQVNLGNDQIQTILQRAQVTNAGVDLATWLGHEGTQVLSAVEPGTLDSPLDSAPELETALKTAREHRPLVKALQAQVLAAEKGVSIARAGYLPSVGTTVTYSRSAPTTNLFFREPSLQNTIGANVLLRWNLFAGFQTMAAVRDAELVQEKAQANLTQYEKDLAGEVFKAHVVLQAQIEAARVADGNRQQAREGLRIATDLYTAGAVSTLELRDAQVKLTNAELSWIQSRIDVELARLVLERSMGTLSKPVM